MANKYRNKKTTVDGVLFDSKKEARRYQDLKLLSMGNVVSDLEIQPEYRIEINGMLVCKYKADFAYKENGKQIVEDVKSEITRKNPTYRIKNKLMKAVHGVDIKEV